MTDKRRSFYRKRRRSSPLKTSLGTTKTTSTAAAAASVIRGELKREARSCPGVVDADAVTQISASDRRHQRSRKRRKKKGDKVDDHQSGVGSHACQ